MRIVQNVSPPAAKPLPLHEHAMENLRFIRHTMQQATAFTAVPGWGLVGMGVTALAAAFIVSRQSSLNARLAIWLIEALVALLIGGYAMDRKSRSTGATLWSVPGRRFVLGLCPPMAAAALLTLVLFRSGAGDILPGVWLLLYGTAVVTAGTVSVKIVPLLGLLFMGMGTVALFCPLSWGNNFMAAGFGGLQIVFGFLIARRHGG